MDLDPAHTAAPAPSGEGSFGPTTALLVFGAFVSVQVAGALTAGLAGLALYTAAGADLDDPQVLARFQVEVTPPSVLLGMLVSGLAAALLARRRIGTRIRAAGPNGVGWVAGRRPEWLRAGLWGAAVCVGGLALGGLLVPFHEAEPGPLAQMAASSAFGFAIFAFIGIALAPLIEEFLFRGVLFYGFTRRWRPLPSAAAVTVLFVVPHLPEAIYYLPGLIGIAGLGVLTIHLRIRTGALGPCIAAHATYNAILVALAHLTPGGVPGRVG